MPIKVKQVSSYVTSDGTEFPSLRDAVQHELTSACELAVSRPSHKGNRGVMENIFDQLLSDPSKCNAVIKALEKWQETRTQEHAKQTD